MTCCSLGEDDAMRMFQRWQKRTLLAGLELGGNFLPTSLCGGKHVERCEAEVRLCCCCSSSSSTRVDCAGGNNCESSRRQDTTLIIRTDYLFQNDKIGGGGGGGNVTTCQNPKNSFGECSINLVMVGAP